MTTIQPTTIDLGASYSEPGVSPVPWAEVDKVLTESEMFWLSTVRTDGRPHVTPLPAIWLGGVLHFCSGDEEQKSVNLRSNPSCVLTTGTDQLFSGLDVIVEGVAERVTAQAELIELAAVWKSKLDWDYQIGDGIFHDGAGHNGLVYGVKPAKVLSFNKKPYIQTRYRFS